MESGLGDPLRGSAVASVSRRIALLATHQAYQRIVSELKGQDRFRPTVFVGSARIDAVAAAAGGEIGEGDSAIVGAEEPAPGGERVILPQGVAAGAVGGGASVDRRVGFE